MNVLDLFSGVGGFSLGLERAGMRTVAFCEIDPFCRKVLRKHWPTTPICQDIRAMEAYRTSESPGNGFIRARSFNWEDSAAIRSEPPINVGRTASTPQAERQGRGASSEGSNRDPRQASEITSSVSLPGCEDYSGANQAGNGSRQDLPNMLGDREGCRSHHSGVTRRPDGIAKSATAMSSLSPSKVSHGQKDRLNDIGPIDVICGGFPCQNISLAGKGEGIDGERSGLWSEYARIIGELRPAFVIVENVAALLNRGLERVLRDLAALGYDAEWHCIPASAVGAPHRRDRLWIVAYTSSEGRRQEFRGSHGHEGPYGPQDMFVTSGDGSLGNVADSDIPRLPIGEMLASIRGQEEWRDARQDAGMGGPVSNADCKPADGLAEPWHQRDHWLIEPDVGRVADGVSGRVDRLRALGNAVVPQISEVIGRAIMRANA